MLFLFICTLLQVNVQSEVAFAGGRIDMVIQTKSFIYIFEFKLNASPQVALAQIHKKKYYERYLTGNKEVYLVGLNFEYETKIITYVIEKL